MRQNSFTFVYSWNSNTRDTSKLYTRVEKSLNLRFFIFYFFPLPIVFHPLARHFKDSFNTCQVIIVAFEQ